MDTLKLSLFPLCEKALLSSCHFQFPPTAATETHSHPHMWTRAHARRLVSLHCQWFSNSPCPTFDSATERGSLGLMSQPPHLLQETKGLRVKCLLLRQPGGVERVDCWGGSSSEGWVDVYLLLSWRGEREREKKEGKLKEDEDIGASQVLEADG